ncbi:MAG: Cysteine desulfurase [Pelotomaculum sp. PtaU1.Bin035]|nr:MAG: Cysteine desulfurase [Pelotomaculum sp. PtaU1.Bin035]
MGLIVSNAKGRYFFRKMRKVYFDHSATTPVRSEVAEEMVRYFTGDFGNPSSLHLWGRKVRRAVEEAREKVACGIGAKPEEIVFTSGGTESDNMAVKGAAYANRRKGNHIITSAVEHHAVLDTCKALREEGFTLTILPVDSYGMVRMEDVAEAIQEKTILISIMHANNEVGTIQPISEIGRLVREKGILLHTDAVQSIGKIPVNVDDLQVDFLAVSGHKLYAPKGVGVLYIRQDAEWQPVSHGGGQERKCRPGTENVSGIVALGKAMELAVFDLPGESQRLAKLRDKIIQGVMDKIPRVRLNGHPTKRLPNLINFIFESVDSKSLLASLDMEGIAASSGSACSAGFTKPSHVLLAMGVSPEIARGSLRLTLGRDNSDEDVEYFLNVLPAVLDRLSNVTS